MKRTRDWWEPRAHLSGEQLGRLENTDGGTARRWIREAKADPTLCDLWGLQPQDDAEVEEDEELQALGLFSPPPVGPAILLYDIETAPGLAWVWGAYEQNAIAFEQDWYMLSFAYKWANTQDIGFVSIFQDPEFYPDTTNDRYVAERLRMLFDKADAVVAHNGDKFDRKKSNQRFLKWGFTPPSPYQSIDTKKIATTNFSHFSNALKELGRVHELGDKEHHTGFELWRECMRGNADFWKTMEKYNCLTPDHKVLGEDLRWKPIGDCKVGDVILGFDEHKPKGHGRQYRKATVLSTRREMADLWKVTFESGKVFRVTADHKWLTARLKNYDSDEIVVRGWDWRETADLLIHGKSARTGWRKVTTGKRNDCVPQLFPVWDEDQTKDAGWLAGMLDGEGCLYHKNNPGQNSAGGPAIMVSQKCGPEADRLAMLIARFMGRTPADFTHMPNSDDLGVLPVRQMRIKGNLAERLEFLGRIRPERLISKVNFDNLGRVESRRNMDRVVSVEPIGRGEVVVMQTSTGTFIADGYPMHNCQDVVLLEKVYNIMLPWMNGPGKQTKVNQGFWHGGKMVCPTCGHDHLTQNGYHRTSVSSFPAYRCDRCGAYSRFRKQDVDEPKPQLV